MAERDTSAKIYHKTGSKSRETNVISISMLSHIKQALDSLQDDMIKRPQLGSRYELVI